MPPLTQDRNTPRAEGDDRTGTLGLNQSIFAGAILMRNAVGDLIEGATAVGSFGVGVAQERVSSTTAGATPVRYRPGVHRFANSTAGDLITKADIGTACFIVDDNQVARTNGTSTRSPAGIVDSVDAQGVWVRFDEALSLAKQYAQYGAGRVIGERLVRESSALYGGRRVIPAPIVPGKGGAGGGGGGAARDEANALQELITSLEGEIEALRVQDPIQRELLKHREALTGATEAEKKQVEELIAVREREAAALEGAKARREFFEDLGNNALEALIVKGESFNDVLKNIAQSLIQAGIQAALFGSGPFGSIFGGKSVLSMIFPALGAKADGGIINGPGTGRSDSILTRLSNGEFVVNAKATARNRHLLEAINAGSLPGYATGGMVGGDNRRTAGRNMGGGPSTLVVDVRGAQGNTEIQEMVRRGVQTGLQLYDREALPRSVQRVSADQKRVN